MLESLTVLIFAALHVVFIFAFAPLLVGIMNKVKARFQGRCGSPVIQPYFDIAKLLSKGTAKSSVTSFIFTMAPVVGFVSIALASIMLPIFSQAPVLASSVIVFIYLFSISRFLTALSGLDSGSSFGGMGSSREMFYSILIEPALFAIIIFLAAFGSQNIAPLAGDFASWQALAASPAYWLIGIALFIAILAETGRLPFDNPATHLELTMVHEAMILENSGPNLALVEWANAAKIFILLSFMSILLLPGSLQSGPFWPALLLASTAVLATIVAAVESMSVKVRLFKVPDLTILATLLAFLAFMTRTFAVNPGAENSLQTMLALVMLLAAIYSIFSIAFRYRVALYIIQSICLVIITVQVSIANGMIEGNCLFLAITAAFKIFIIPFFLYRSLSFGMKLMPLRFYLRFVAAKRSTRSSLESDPLFMQSHITTSRSLLYAGILVALSFLISSALGGTTLMLPIAASIILIGMLIIATKSHLILQLFGFLMMENGVVLLPSALHIRLPLIGETIALLDVVILVAIALLLSFKMRETHGTLDTQKFMELVEQR